MREEGGHTFPMVGPPALHAATPRCPATPTPTACHLFTTFTTF